MTRPVAAPTMPAEPSDSMFAILSFTWACAILVHQTFHVRLEPWPDVLLNLVAVWTLLRPSSPLRLGALAVAHLAVIGWHMPVVTNHWMLLAFGDVALLAGLVAALASGGPRGLTRERWLAGALPILRWMLLFLYVFATLTKLNTGFLDPELSCATSHLRKLCETLPFLPFDATSKAVAIWGTIAFEGALPLLLLLRWTRTAAVLAGLLFHVVLGVNGYHDFSAALVVFYVAFLPADTTDRLRRVGERFGRLRRGAAGFAAAAAPWLGALVVFASQVPRLSEASRGQLYRWVHTPFHFVWLAYALGLIALIASLWRAGGEREPAPGTFRIRIAGGVAMLLFALNAASPYLGLKTENSLTMFSNLQTEGDQWNHVVVPRFVRAFDLQDDLVELRASSDRHLQSLAERHHRVVWLELRRYLLERPDASVTYVRGGETRAVPRAGDDPALAAPLHPLARKLLWFRSVPRPEDNRCQH